MERLTAHVLTGPEPTRELREARQRAVDAVDRVRHTVQTIELDVHYGLDWRRQVRARPHLWVAGLFFLGFLLGDRANS